MASSVDRFPVHNFAQYLERHITYKDCRVIAMTHTKNMNSSVLHEYLHILICDKDFRTWRRLLVERTTQQDQVVIGLWPWTRSSLLSRSGDRGSSGSGSGPSGSGSSGGGSGSYEEPLPLLMRNVIFDQPLYLRDVASVLVKIHDRRTRYNLLSANCFWYSDAVFEALRGKNTVRTWGWSGLKGKAFVLNSSAKEKMCKEAEKFRNSLPEDPFRGENGRQDVPDQDPEDDRIYAMGQNAIQDEIQEDEFVVKAMKEIDFVKNLDESAIRDKAAEHKNDLKQFTAAILADSEKETNLEAYKAHISQEPLEIDDDPDSLIEELQDALRKINVDAMTKEDEDNYEEALHTFVGGVLRQSL